MSGIRAVGEFSPRPLRFLPAISIMSLPAALYTAHWDVSSGYS